MNKARLDQLRLEYRQPINYEDPEFARFVPYKNFNTVDGLIDFCTEYVTNDIVMIELGTGRGVSTEVFANFAKFVYSIDMTRYAEVEKRLFNYSNVKLIVGNTYDMWKLFEEGSIDLLYFDSDHEYNHVKKEIRLYRKLLRANGVFSGHDFSEEHEGNVRAVKETLGEPIKVYKDSSWVIENSGILI